MDAFDNLKNAIVRQAAEDYAAAFMGCSIDGKSPEDTMLECERFFRSDWYDTLTRGAVDGEWLMRNINWKYIRISSALATAVRLRWLLLSSTIKAGKNENR